MAASVLLVSSDARVIQNVRQAVTSVPGCSLDVVKLGELCPRSARTAHATLLIFHLAEREAESQLRALLASRKRSPQAVIALCDRYDTNQGMELLQRGVADYLGRPLNLGRIAMLTDVLTAKVRLNEKKIGRSAESSLARTAGTLQYGSFLCCSQQMTRLVDDARTVAPLQSTVLLHGETGTGKTRVARLIHDLSPRHDQPFMVVNCASLSASLIESELFGHVKGAFTGADQDREGKCAAARRGTLMLDDIDALTLSTQSKLLRAVDERVFEPVGSNRAEPLSARIIVATNQPLQQEVEAGRFRADLYYRINVVALHLAPLRERAEMIEPLARQFLAELGLRDRGRVWDISDDALAALKAHNWPGNIRELRNVLERAVALGSGHQCQLRNLPDSFQRPPAGRHDRTSQSRWRTSKLDVEARVIGEALARCGNNRSQAARDLGISRVALYKMLHKHGFI